MERADMVAFWKRHKEMWNSGKVASEPDATGMSIIEVISRGRTSGEERTVLLSSLPLDDGWLVTASNIGDDHDPNWWRNLQAAGLHGEVRTAHDGDRTPVDVVELHGDERQAAWDRLVAAQELYAGYEQATTRVIPVLELHPTS